MKNQYPGTCIRCAGHVGTGEGIVRDVTIEEAGAWGITHMKWWKMLVVEHTACATAHKDDFAHYVNRPTKGELG